MAHLDVTELRKLADELGYWPATTDEADIERHRRLNAALDAAPSAEKVGKKFAHLHEAVRQERSEQAARLIVADLYDDL